VPPSLGGLRGCGGGVVDFGFHALAAVTELLPDIATLARNMPCREVKLRGQLHPVKVISREVYTFAPTVVLRAATLVEALAGRECR